MTDEKRRTRATNLTEETLQKMRDLDAQGISRVEIAKQFGYTPSTLSKRLGRKRPIPQKAMA